jgi:hypothetical protein
MSCSSLSRSSILPAPKVFVHGRVQVHYSYGCRVWSAYLNGTEERVASLFVHGRNLYVLRDGATQKFILNPNPAPNYPDRVFVGKRSAYNALLNHAKAALERRDARVQILLARWNRLRAIRALLGDACEQSPRAAYLQSMIERRLWSFARDVALSLVAITERDVG